MLHFFPRIIHRHFLAFGGLKGIAQKYENVFGDISLGRPPNRGVDDVIELEVGTLPIMIQPYKHPKILKDEIEGP